MRIAHISDLHMACRPGAGEYNAKRCLGYLNYLLFRSRRYRARMAAAVLRLLLAKQPDVLVITGDLTQHGLNAEFTLAEDFFRPALDAGVPVLAIPGNHDAYGAGSLERFEQLRIALASGKLPGEDGIIRFPGVELAPLAQAVASPLFYSCGVQDSGELSRLERAWQNDAAGIVRLVFGHYPIVKNNGCGSDPRRGLRGAEALRDFCIRNRVRGYLCGHDHQAYRVEIAEGCNQYVAPALSDVQGDAAKLFFLYDCDPAIGCRVVE